MKRSSIHLSILTACLSFSDGFAMLGIQNPNRLIYTSGSAESRWIILKECFPSDLKPSQNCDKNAETGEFSESSYELPTVKALKQSDFIETILFREENQIRLSPNEKARYLPPKGIEFVEADLLVYESRLSKGDADNTEIESVRMEIDRLQTIHAGLVQAHQLIERMIATDLEIVTRFNGEWKLSEKAFGPRQPALLILDRRQKLWIRYLGEGDYYDANNTTRIGRFSIGPFVNEISQRNLGGCKKNFGEGYRLPTLEELRAMRRDESLAIDIDVSYNIFVSQVRAHSNGYLDFYNQLKNSDYLVQAPILCVMKP